MSTEIKTTPDGKALQFGSIIAPKNYFLLPAGTELISSDLRLSAISNEWRLNFSQKIVPLARQYTFARRLPKPETWTLPPPPEGREWHYGEAFRAADLPEGYRPLLRGEEVLPGDEFCEPSGWVPCACTGFPLAPQHGSRRRTKRPLPVEDPYAELKAACAAGKVIQARSYGEWHDEDFSTVRMEDFSLNFLRVKPSPVPLGPEDVPPGSALRNKCSVEALPWHLALCVSDTEITMTGSQCLYTLRFDSETLMSEWEILRPGHGWQPCHKPAP